MMFDLIFNKYLQNPPHPNYLPTHKYASHIPHNPTRKRVRENVTKHRIYKIEGNLCMNREETRKIYYLMRAVGIKIKNGP
jgi:hypothetical protein